MRGILTLLVAVAAIATAASAEDEAHRLDRMQTRLLNARAAALARAAMPATAQPQSADDTLRLREEAAVARWRAGNTGGRSPCTPGAPNGQEPPSPSCRTGR